MANKNDMQEDGIVVEMTDEQGNKYYYEEETIIPVADEKFAILVGIHNDEEGGHTCTCGCGCEDGDEDVLVAKIVLDENGEEEYVEPTDEEFARFQQAYEALVEESEAEE